MINTICTEHTDLSATDIEQIHTVAGNLPMIADLMGADIFIDCPTRNPDVAIVVAQARPSNSKSLYKGSVVAAYAYRANEPAALRTLDVGMPTKDMLATTQENQNVRQNVSAIKNAAGKVIGCLIAETDISADIKVKKSLSILSDTTEQLTEALLYSKPKDQGIPYHVTDGIVIFDRKGIVIFANPSARDIYKKIGYSNIIEGLNFANLALEEIEFMDILDSDCINSPEIKFANLVLNVTYLVIKRRSKDIASVAMLIRDNTDVKAKEKELVLKSVAIKEIHHRVKNNLQTIASLLRLQSRRIDNDSVEKAFKESINRVLSIAATHEILAEKGLDDVDLKVMLKRIIKNVAGHNYESGGGIKTIIQGDSIQTNSDIASSIALVVNELIQNCYKHAFIDRKNGSIHINIRKESNYCSISIIDDGVGFDVDSKLSASSLGNQIIKQLVSDKLRGKLQVESGENGTSVLFDFLCNAQTCCQNDTI